MPTLWRLRFARLKKLGFLALLSLLLLIAGLLVGGGGLAKTLLALGLLGFIPGALYLITLTMWHWKARYRGSHSDLWGALLLLEATGWFKLIYLFRHIIPDARQSGRYAAPE